MFSRETHADAWFQEKRVTVMGLGLFGGGVGVAEFLCRRGAYVTVTDLKTREQLAPSVEALGAHPIRWVLGEHREEDFTGADLVVVSPAVPRDVEWIRLAAKSGVPLDTEMNLFFKHCRGRICGVTGSNGKTTTASLVHAMAAGDFPSTRLGGNLGRSLLPEVDEIGPEDWVVLELSSFQLEDLASLEQRPEVAVVTNLTPNHLDRHGTFERYAEAKRVILDAPERSDALPGRAVLYGEDPRLRAWASATMRAVQWFGRSGDVTPRAEGVWVRGIDAPAGDAEVIATGGDGASEALFRASDSSLHGAFNLVNAAAAACAARSMGASAESIRAGLRAFRPVPHRLERVFEHEGVEFFDDSIATTPESTIAALGALGPDVILICGGSRKGCAFDALAREVASNARAALLIGTTAEDIERAMRATGRGAGHERCGTLERAVERAFELARPGDRVLLSPACPSYDQFANFVERGLRFRELVQARCAARERS